jgi:hypothetical protein
MARRPGTGRADESLFFDVLYEDGTQTSNRKVPWSELEGIDGTLPAKRYIEEQDRKIAKMSGKPRGPINSVTRASRR